MATSSLADPPPPRGGAEESMPEPFGLKECLALESTLHSFLLARLPEKGIENEYSGIKPCRIRGFESRTPPSLECGRARTSGLARQMRIAK